uniref:Lipoprotein n=1 Tax=Pseudenhygromyxa salsuginis TaxID=442868 RepID=A0A3S7UWK0_9BACT|nr:hypothetical protein [Pseudenhygromyxa salsuginis]
MLRCRFSWLLSALLTLSCQGKQTGTPSDGAPSPDGANDTKQASEPDPPTGAEQAGEPWRERTRTHLLLRRHGPKMTTADYVAVTIGDTLEASPPLTSTATPLAFWPDHFASRAAHDGRNHFVIATGDAAPWQLRRHELGADGTVQVTDTVEIGEVVPAALHLVGDQLFMGQDNAVIRIDFAGPQPQRTEVHRRPDMIYKAYDLFVRDLEWLLAIDDEVVPIYAESLGLHQGAAPVREAGWELPGAINGHYYAGVLARRPGHAHGERNGTLYVLVSYGIMDGNGQDLAALPIRDGALTVEPELIINGGGRSKLPVLEEHVDRGSGEPRTLLAGAAFSPWRALARYLSADGRETLLLCAGPRDILAVPADFDGDSKASIVEIDGDCLDLLVDDGRIWALVDPDPSAADQPDPDPEAGPPSTSELLELALSAGDSPKATVLRRVALAGFDAIVR